VTEYDDAVERLGLGRGPPDRVVAVCIVVMVLVDPPADAAEFRPRARAS
jgi:hypothetical protein